MKTQNKALIIPILNDEYKVVVCWGDKKFVARVGIKYNYKEYIYIDDDSRGRVWYEERNCPIIVLRGYPKTAEYIGTLAHEAFHAVNYIYRYIGEQISGSEIFAHSVASIVRNTLIYGKVNNIKIK